MRNQIFTMSEEKLDDLAMTMVKDVLTAAGMDLAEFDKHTNNLVVVQMARHFINQAAALLDENSMVVNLAEGRIE